MIEINAVTEAAEHFYTAYMRSAHKLVNYKFVLILCVVCYFGIRFCCCFNLLSFYAMGDASDSANKAQISVYTDSQFYRPCRYGSFQLALKRCPLSQHFMHIHGEMNTYGELNETSHKANDWMLNRVANNPDIYMRTRYSRCFVAAVAATSFFFSFRSMMSTIGNDITSVTVHYAQLCLQLARLSPKWEVVSLISMLFPFHFIVSLIRCKARHAQRLLYYRVKWESTSRLINSLTRPIVIAFTLCALFSYLAAFKALKFNYFGLFSTTTIS